MSSLAEVTQVASDRAVAESARRVGERIATTKEVVAALLQEPESLARIEKFEELKQVADFFELATRAQQDLMVYAKIFLPLQHSYNSKGGSVPDVMLAQIPGLTEHERNIKAEGHAQALRTASVNLSKTFREFLQNGIDRAKVDVGAELTARFDVAAKALLAEIRQLGEIASDDPRQALRTETIELLRASVDSHIGAVIVSRAQVEALSKLLGACEETTRRLGELAENPVMPVVTPELAQPEPALQPAVGQVVEPVAEPLALQQLATTPRMSLTPRTKALIELFEACVDVKTGDVRRFDFAEKAYQGLMDSLDTVAVKAVSQELAVIDEGVDPVIDRFRAAIDEHVAGVAKNQISEALAPLDLSEESRTRLLDLIAETGITPEEVATVVGAVGSDPALAESALSRMLERGEVTREVARALVTGFQAFERLLKSWKYDEVASEEIATKLAVAVRNWSDIGEWDAVKNTAGSSIKKYLELYGNCPGPQDLLWDQIDREYDLLVADLKRLNNTVRQQLRDMGVANENVIGAVIKEHFAEHGPKIGETARRYRELASCLNRPLYNSAGGSTKLIDATGFPARFWFTVATMTPREWTEYAEALGSIWKYCDGLSATAFDNLKASDLTTVLQIRKLLKHNTDSAGMSSGSDSRANRPEESVEGRIRMALEVDCRQRLAEMNDDVITAVVTTIHFLSIRRGGTTFDNLRGLKFEGQTDVLEAALFELAQAGLVEKKGRDFYQLVVSRHSLLEKALNKHVSAQKFLEDYAERMAA